MISLANPKALLLLLVIPVIALLYIAAIVAKKRKLSRFGSHYIAANLMPEASRYMPAVKFVLTLVAVILLIVALARPYTTSVLTDDKQEEETSGIEIMICFDVSNSMLASSTDDANGVSRLQRAKFILEKLIDKLRMDKVGLIVFAGDAYTQLPITSDFISAKMFLNGLTTDAVPTQGTAIGTAIDMAVNSFSPESQFQKAILLITDVENFEDDALSAAKQASSAGIQVDVIGVGGEKPMPIPVSENSTDYIVDASGQPAESTINVTLGQQIVKAGKGAYISGNDPDAVQQVVDQLKTLGKTDYKRKLAADNTNELFPIAILMALIILLIDMFMPNSKIKWLTKYNFFSKK